MWRGVRAAAHAHTGVSHARAQLPTSYGCRLLSLSTSLNQNQGDLGGPAFKKASENFFDVSRLPEFFHAQPDPITPYDKKVMKNANLLMPEVGPVRHVKINRPLKYNTLDDTTQVDLYKVLFKWARDKSGRAIVLEGDENYFCGGSDLKSLYHHVTSGEGTSPADYYRHQYKLFYLLSRIRKPFLPYIRGKCIGAGVGLGLSSTLGVGTETSSFSFSSARIGLPLEGGATFWLSKLPMNLGKMLALTGHPLSNCDLFNLGILSHNMYNDTLHLLKENFINASTAEWQQVLTSMVEFHDVISHFQFTASELQMIEHCFAPDSIEDIIIELEKQDDPLGPKLAGLVRKSSPLASYISLELIKRGRDLDRRKSLQLEHRAVRRAVEKSPDFLEGVRSNVLEKRRPIWSSSFGGVSSADVEEYLKEYPDVKDELSLRDPFSDLRHLDHVPMAKIRMLNDHIQRKAEVLCQIDFSADDPIDPRTAIRAHYEKHGIEIEQDLGSKEGQDGSALGSADFDDEGEEEGDEGNDFDDDDELGENDEVMMEGDEHLMKLMVEEQSERRRLIDLANQSLEARQPFFEVKADKTSPFNVFRDEEREQTSFLPELLKDADDSLFVKEIPTALLLHHLSEPRQLREDVDRYVLALCDTLRNRGQETYEKIVNSGRINVNRNMSTYSDTSKKTMAEAVLDGDGVVQLFPKELLDYASNAEQAAIKHQLTQLEKQIEGELKDLFEREDFTKLDNILGENYPTPRDQEFEKLFIDLINGDKLAEPEKFFIIRIYKVVKKWHGRLLHCQDIDAEKRKYYSLKLRELRDGWITAVQASSPGTAQTVLDPDMSKFFEEIEKKGASGALAVELVISERCRQWIEAVRDTKANVDVVHGIEEGIQALRKNLQFRLSRVAKLEKGLRSFLKETKALAPEIARDQVDDDAEQAARVKKALKKHILVQDYAAFFTPKEFLFILRRVLNQEQSDPWTTFVEIVAYTTYKVRRHDFLQTEASSLTLKVAEMEEQFRQAKKKELEEERLYAAYGGKKLKKKQEGKGGAGGDGQLDLAKMPFADPYKGLDLRPLSFEDRF